MFTFSELEGGLDTEPLSAELQVSIHELKYRTTFSWLSLDSSFTSRVIFLYNSLFIGLSSIRLIA